MQDISTVLSMIMREEDCTPLCALFLLTKTNSIGDEDVCICESEPVGQFNG